MVLGYDGKLYILAFDHRGSFQKKMFGIEGAPTPEETETISDAKKLIFEGMKKAVERGVDPGATGVLVNTAHTLQVRVTGTRNASATNVRVDVDAFVRWT